MGLFWRKSDPISARARALQKQIHALEAQIERLAAQEKPPPEPLPTRVEPPPPPASLSAPPTPTPPRFRSTAVPHAPSQAAQPPVTGSSFEPVFEDMDQGRLQEPEATARSEPTVEIGLRRNDLNSSWQRFKKHLQGPVTSNPRLVSYLAAGSIQGLRPLRYEKRIARNRFIALAGLLVLLLWGIVAILLRHR
jgi:hypothetical protein